MLKLLIILTGVLGFGVEILDAYSVENTERLFVVSILAVVVTPLAVWAAEWVSRTLTDRSEQGVLLHWDEKLTTIRGYPCIVKKRSDKLVGLVEKSGVFRRKSLVRLYYQGAWLETKVRDIRIPDMTPTSVRRIKVRCLGVEYWREPDHLELLSTDNVVAQAEGGVA
ncbi:MAG: hypothetical protein KBD16_00375 [Candidatus Pacebacteria bacterium]|nr:hypothetical protein [Candidatus Paceibacterota bacterium]